METTHRKIELQSPLDLLYLHSNASSLLRSKLDLHFPPSAAPASASDDVLKQRVEELSSAWLDKVYADVKANLSINGLEGKQMEEAMVMAEGKGEGEFDGCCFLYTQQTREKCEANRNGGTKQNKNPTIQNSG
jgi:kinetochor protein Mis14/NSL1